MRFAASCLLFVGPCPTESAVTGLAGDVGNDVGNVERNLVRGPSQNNIDFSIGKRFPLIESKDFEFRADPFNLLNHANRDPVSDLAKRQARAGRDEWVNMTGTSRNAAGALRSGSQEICLIASDCCISNVCLRIKGTGGFYKRLKRLKRLGKACQGIFCQRKCLSHQWGAIVIAGWHQDFLGID